MNSHITLEENWFKKSVTIGEKSVFLRKLLKSFFKHWTKTERPCATSPATLEPQWDWCKKVQNINLSRHVWNCKKDIASEIVKYQCCTYSNVTGMIHHLWILTDTKKFSINYFSAKVQDSGRWNGWWCKKKFFCSWTEQLGVSNLWFY